MLIKKYKAKVVSIDNNISGVYAITFKSLDKPFKYDPGQFLHLSLDTEFDGSGQWPESRCFSMQSNPNDETIKITYAIKGKFTKQMEEQLKAGSEVWLKLPYGDLFTQPHNKTNTVFIAGGTGITPFLSLFTHESFNEYTNPRIYLGFRSKEYNIYHDELDRSCNSSKFVKYFFEDTDGLIDMQFILNNSPATSAFFISGPPIMIKAFKQSLIANGVPANKVLTDDWE